MIKSNAIILLAILCLLSVSVLSIAANGQADEAWTMFHNDLTHTGYSSNTNPSTNQTLWVFPTGGKIWSSPIIFNGIVYFGSLDHHIYAVNATDGRKIWDYTAGNRVYPSPAVYNNAVYIGSDD
jgi:outer membrane protein assembly factor BamB